jgi:hypothetical protein
LPTTAPAGDVNPEPSLEGQPFISDFTVQLNGAAIPYKVTIVHDSLYYRNGTYKAYPLAKAKAGADPSSSILTLSISPVPWRRLIV